MVELTRRRFVACAAATSGIIAVPPNLWSIIADNGANVSVRYDVSTPEGVKMLEKYAQAAAIMTNKAEGDPLGWLFQWYTHSVRRDRSKVSEIARVYQGSTSPNSALAGQMWETCQAHHGEDENMFLPWHRMFVLSFERIIRGVIGDPSFTLPYWSYTHPQNRSIPKQFITPGDPTFGSLYRPNRKPSTNAGDPIDKGIARSPLNTDSLKLPAYPDDNDSVQGFCSDLDNGLHGQVHVLVGNGLGMGSVPWAANDPIFWLHHCNIDRMWSSWNALGGKNPNDASFLSQPFVFAGPKGQRADLKVGDILDTAVLGYKYDSLEPSPSGAAPFETLQFGTGPSQTLARTATGVKLGKMPTTAKLQTVPSPETVSPNVLGLASQRNIYLVIRDLATNLQPEILYEVFLELQEKPSEQTLAAHSAGFISFFDTEHLSTSSDSAHVNRKFFSFNVTTLLQQARKAGLTPDGPKVTLAPVGTPIGDAQPVIGEISLVAR
jgi:tyrosinase